MKKSLLALSLIAFLSTAAFAMDKGDIPGENAEAPKTRLTLGQLNPFNQEITTLDDLAEYAHKSGDSFYFNTTSGLTQGGGSATELYIIQKWDKNGIVGILSDNGHPIKAFIAKNQITGAYTDGRYINAQRKDIP